VGGKEVVSLPKRREKATVCVGDHRGTQVYLGQILLNRDIILPGRAQPVAGREAREAPNSRKIVRFKKDYRARGRKKE